LPDDFTSTLTVEEETYLAARSWSGLEPLFIELLPELKAAGVLSLAPSLLIDVHRKEPLFFSKVDGICLPLAEEPATAAYLRREFLSLS
jgi:hypothetical protein